MKKPTCFVIAGFIAFALTFGGAAQALTYEKIESIDLGGVNITMKPAEIESSLKLSGYTEKSSLPGLGTNTKIKAFERIDSILGDKESVELTYNEAGTQSLTYKHNYNQKTLAPNWHNTPFAGEIEYALAILCDTDATDPRDCKDAKKYKGGEQRIFTVEARRKGGYQLLNLARFSTTFEGFSWMVKRAGAFE